MLQVDLDHILPESDAFTRIREIIDHVEQEKEVYVLTKDGRPVVAIVNVDMLEKSEEEMPVVQMATLNPSMPFSTAAPEVTLENFTPVLTQEPALITEPTPVWSAPATLPPLPLVLPSLPISAPALPPPFPGLPPAVTQPIYPDSTTALATSGSILDEPLPPLRGTEFLQSPPSLIPPTPPSR